MKIEAGDCSILAGELFLEKSFQACDMYDPCSGFGVIDAECELVCTCNSAEKAALVAAALNAFRTVEEGTCVNPPTQR